MTVVVVPSGTTVMIAARCETCNQAVCVPYGDRHQGNYELDGNWHNCPERAANIIEDAQPLLHQLVPVNLDGLNIRPTGSTPSCSVCGSKVGGHCEHCFDPARLAEVAR